MSRVCLARAVFDTKPNTTNNQHGLAPPSKFQPTPPLYAVAIGSTLLVLLFEMYFPALYEWQRYDGTAHTTYGCTTCWSRRFGKRSLLSIPYQWHDVGLSPPLLRRHQRIRMDVIYSISRCLSRLRVAITTMEVPRSNDNAFLRKVYAGSEGLRLEDLLISHYFPIAPCFRIPSEVPRRCLL